MALIKKPYFAILTTSSFIVPEGIGKVYSTRYYDYSFLDLRREKVTSVPPHLFKYYFDGYLQVGTILKGRIHLGETYFYEVSYGGLMKISEVEAIKKLTRFKSNPQK